MIIDSHVHLMAPPHNDEIASLSLENGTTLSLGIPRSELSPDRLIESMDENGVDKAIIVALLGWLDNQSLSHIIMQHSQRFIGFASVDDPRNEDAVSQLEYAVKDHGLKGLKLCSEVNGITLSDPEIVPLVRKAAELKIPVYCHSWGGFPGYFYHNLPWHFDTLNQRVPEATLIIGHMCVQRFMDLIPLISRPNVYTETSGGLKMIADLHGPEFAVRFLRKIGVEKVIWGSDWKGSIAPIKPELDLINSLELTSEERDSIFYKNISQILS